jgi:hypothetical protein
MEMLPRFVGRMLTAGLSSLILVGTVRAEPPPEAAPRPLAEWPLNVPDKSGTMQRFDDFTFAAASWTLTAHEARPGHELQFASIVEHGVSDARMTFAFNSTNVEGSGLYAEWLMEPYEPDDGRLICLQHRLMRAARAFLDIELQTGKITREQALATVKQDVVVSDPMANQEVERYTFGAPGQANAYFYGYTRLRALRDEVEKAMGDRFRTKAFHDFILAQGLLPPRLLRKAVLEGFIGRTTASLPRSLNQAHQLKRRVCRTDQDDHGVARYHGWCTMEI